VLLLLLDRQLLNLAINKHTTESSTILSPVKMGSLLPFYINCISIRYSGAATDLYSTTSIRCTVRHTRQPSDHRGD